MTLIDYLERLYLEFEPRIEWQKSITMKGMEGAARIAALMKRLKDDPPTSLTGVPVARRTRVDLGAVRDGQTGETIGTVALPKSDVIVFDLADGSKVVARPSGTEPKIKFYFFLLAPKQEDVEGVRAALKGLDTRRAEFQEALLQELGIG